MSWRLWLDDQINDPETPVRWTPVGYLGAASVDEAIALVQQLGPPAHVDLDHDLGEDAHGHELTAKPLAKWLSENYPDSPPTCEIHSRNRDGGKWLTSHFDSWTRSLGIPRAEEP